MSQDSVSPGLDPDRPSPEAPDAEPDVLVVPCATHPSVQTALRCGRCDTPICPKCLVMTPVGARCRACARLKKAKVFRSRLSGWIH